MFRVFKIGVFICVVLLLVVAIISIAFIKNINDKMSDSIESLKDQTIRRYLSSTASILAKEYMMIESGHTYLGTQE